MNIHVELPENKEEISVRIDEAKEIRSIVEKNNLNKCLEVGLAYGMSANYILSASSTVRLTSLDPFQKSDYNNLGLANIQQNGYSDRHIHIDKLSSIALPEMLSAGEKFDFVFIDGDHKFEAALIDFIYAAELVEIGGIIVVDDLWMRALQLVKEYVKRNRPDFQELKLNSVNLFAFKKISEDQRDGMFFREFYTRKGFLKYHLNRLAWEDKTVFGKLIKQVKNIVRGR